jgi:hypothetical protein
MGTFLAVPLLPANQITTFDVTAHGGDVPAERSGQSAQAKEGALRESVAHPIGNVDVDSVGRRHVRVHGLLLRMSIFEISAPRVEKAT